MIRRSKDKSRAATSHLAIPCPKGLEYMPYQIAGVEYMSNRPRVLVADEPGLGKTIEAIALANYRDHRKILVIAPASVKINWCLEIHKWSTFGLRAVYISGRNSEVTFDNDVVVINYELLSYYQDILREHIWDLLVVDEAHYLKSNKADRTGQVFGRKRAKGPTKPFLSPIPYKNILLLTGTPILNKPKELWPLIQVLDPDGLGSDWFSFARRYCKLFELKKFNSATGKEEHLGWKWDEADNLEELQSIMRQRFMLRRLKKDVLKELPPKTRQILVLEAKKGLTNLFKRETMEYSLYSQNHGAEIIEPPEFSKMSELRKEVAVAKIPYVIEYLKEMLNETQKIVCFVHHHEVGDAIVGAFGTEATLVDGRVSSEDRQHRVDRFQSDPTCRIFVGSIQAAGIGITLTAASLAVFAELDWTPALVSQAEDRLHRLGQKENVLVRHIVLNGSIEQRIVQAIIRKQEIAEKALDKEN